MRREHLDDIQIPRELYGRLRQRIAEDLGYENRAALLDADNDDEYAADRLTDDFVTQAIEHELVKRDAERIVRQRQSGSEE